MQTHIIVEDRFIKNRNLKVYHKGRVLVLKLIRMQVDFL